MQKLPCGCQFDNVGDAFVYEPCALDCEYYLYVISEGKKQGKDMTHLEMP